MLIGKYKIESDELNIIVCSKRRALKGKKAGEDYWKPEGYFSTTKGALDFLVEHEIKGTGFKDFESVAQKQKEIHGLIANLETLPSKKKPSKV